MADENDLAESPSSMLWRISEAMTAIYKDQFGRGPTRTRTEWAGADTIVVTLEDTLTPAERNLAAMGEDQRLRDMRLLFQYSAVAEFCDPVERNTGRRVKAFMSGIDTRVNGLSVEVFVLHPKGSDAPSRMTLGDNRGRF